MTFVTLDLTQESSQITQETGPNTQEIPKKYPRNGRMLQDIPKKLYQKQNFLLKGEEYDYKTRLKGLGYVLKGS